MTEEKLLELVDVGRHFGSVSGTVRAVDNVSLFVRSGETLGLVGESGCGKSTLARLALRLVRPSFGEIYFQGQKLDNGERGPLLKFRRHVQAIFQNPYASLNTRMTVREILREPFEIHSVNPPEGIETRLQDLLVSVGLRPLDLEKTPQQFSGGQLQRIAIARALALEPSLIVADEPTSALDPSIQAQIINLFLSIQQLRKLAILIISHDLGVVSHIADRVVVMYLGIVVEVGASASLLTGPLHPYTQALLSAGPRLGTRQSSGRKRIVLAGDLPSPTSIPTGCRFHPRCPFARDRCRVEVPQLRAIGDHDVACHFAPDLTAAVGRDVVAGQAYASH